MKYGVLGDIHGNLLALQAVLEEIDAEGVDCLLSTGDIVGYGAAPAECIEILRSRGAIAVKGNHDAACLRELDDSAFNPYARAAIAWTRTALAQPDLEYLRRLPYVQSLEHCQLAHGTLYRPELFDYILSSTDADPSLEIQDRPVCFVGHSHVPLTVLRLRETPERSAYTLDSEIDFSEVDKALVNVGSVGQPRDEDPRAAFVIYDTEADMAWVRRCGYDIPGEADRIRAAGLPPVLADRLALGL